jgi:hypothetical protein
MKLYGKPPLWEATKSATAGIEAMALKHFIHLGSLLAACLISISPALGQVFKPGPKFEHRPLESPTNTRPFATPGFFDYDMQMFAPVDFSNNEEMQARCGFYGGIDRMYSSFSKSGNFGGPNGAAISKGSEYIWGNRYEFGWLSTLQDGWGLVYNNSQGMYYTNGQDELVANPMIVNQHFANVEVNRIFRQCLKSGGYFEPFIGFRYFNVTDTTIEDTLQVLNAVVVNNRFKQDVTNNMFGAHAGGKFIQHMGRWRTSTRGAIATTYNRQCYFATDIATTTVTQGISEFYETDSSFTPALDLGFDISYYFTRDLSVKLGLHTVYIWDGIARANVMTTSINPNSAFSAGGLGPQGLFEDSVVSAGFSFGVEWRK